MECKTHELFRHSLNKLVKRRNLEEHSNKHFLMDHSIIYITAQGWVGVAADVTLVTLAWSIV